MCLLLLLSAPVLPLCCLVKSTAFIVCQEVVRHNNPVNTVFVSMYNIGLLLLSCNCSSLEQFCTKTWCEVHICYLVAISWNLVHFPSTVLNQRVGQWGWAYTLVISRCDYVTGPFSSSKRCSGIIAFTAGTDLCNAFIKQKHFLQLNASSQS